MDQFWLFLAFLIHGSDRVLEKEREIEREKIEMGCEAGDGG